MNWNQEFAIVDRCLYLGDRELGEFSSHTAAYAGLHWMRHGELWSDCAVMTDGDRALFAEIDAIGG